VKPVCLITGAGGRLGGALCAHLQERYEIVAVYHNTVPPVSSQLRRRLTDPDSGAAYCVQADLTSRDDIRRVVDVALARYGQVDAVINSAADIRFHGKLLELWESDPYADAQLHLNCVSPIYLVSAIFQQCWKDAKDENVRWNRNVVNVSSMSALNVNAIAGQAYYSASKASLNMLTRYLSVELKSYGVRANAICPGSFRNESSTQVVVKAIDAILNSQENGATITDLSSSTAVT